MTGHVIRKNIHFAYILPRWVNMPVAYLPEQDRFQLSCSAARKLPVKVFFKKWQGQYDLNSQPTVLETVALPVELYPFLL